LARQRQPSVSEPGVARAEGIAQIKIHNKKLFHNKRLNKIKPSNQKGIALNQSYNALKKNK